MTVRRWAALGAVLAAAAALYLVPVGRRVLYHQDEARFAILARQAVEEGRWFLPLVRGHVYLNKPPYYFWAMAAVALPFGRVDETTAPLASVLAALATLAATFAIARRLWGADVGLVAVLALATAPFFFAMAHQVLSDMMLTAWLTWALYLYLRAVGEPAAPRWALPAFYLCVGGGLGTKGPAALIVVLAAVGASLATDGGAGVRRLRLGLGAKLIALCALPWLLPYALQRDGSYPLDVVLGHYGDWYFRSKPSSRLDRLGENLAGVLPWILFLALAPWWWRRTWGADRGRIRLIVWAAVIGVGVSLSGEQRARYFLPVDPLLALLVAEIIVGSARERVGRHLLAGALALGLVGALAGAALVAASGSIGRGRDTPFLPTSRTEVWLLAGFAAIAWTLAFLALVRGAGGTALAAGLALGMGGILAVTAVNYPGRYTRARPMGAFAEQVRAVVPPDVTIWAYPEASLTYDLHLRRQVREIAPTYRVLWRMHNPAIRALLTRQEHWWHFQGAVDPAWRVAASGRIDGHTMVLLRRGS